MTKHPKKQTPSIRLRKYMKDSSSIKGKSPEI